MRKIIFVLLCGAFLGSCGSWVVCSVLNKDGDGIDPSQTLTATLMGVERGTHCVYYPNDGIDDGGWQCEPFADHIDPWGKEHESEYRERRPITTSLALGVFPLLEWVVLLFLIGLTLPPEMKEEPDEMTAKAETQAAEEERTRNDG